MNIRRICDYVMGLVDVMSCILIFLPLYPNPIDGYIYSVNLFSYTGLSDINRLIYWIIFLALVVIGGVKVVLTYFGVDKAQKGMTAVSMFFSVLTVLFLAMTREPYAITLVFLLLMIKVITLLKRVKADK